MSKKGEIAATVLLVTVAIIAIYAVLTIPLKNPTGSRTLSSHAIMTTNNTMEDILIEKQTEKLAMEEPPKQETPEANKLTKHTGTEKEYVKTGKETTLSEALRPGSIALLIMAILTAAIYASWKIGKPKDVNQICKELDRIRKKLEKKSS